MRSITWPTHTDAFIVFTVILPFLLSTVNGVSLSFVSPSPDASGHGGLYFAGQKYEIIWNYTIADTSSATNDFGGVCNLYLVDMNTGPNQTLAMGVPLATRSLATNLAVTVYLGSTMITYPPETIPGSEYLIDLESESIGSWHSNPFTIAYH